MQSYGLQSFSLPRNLLNCKALPKREAHQTGRTVFQGPVSYLKLVQEGDPNELLQVTHFHKALKKNFYNDYRKKLFGLAAFYYCIHQENLGNHLLFQEVGFERDLRPRQKAFYYETVALYEYLYGSLDEARNALYIAAEIFAKLPDYVAIIRHNLHLLGTSTKRPKFAKFYCGGNMEDDIYYADPRSAW